jgi:predicted phage terminase large subunit-like protein
VPVDAAELSLSSTQLAFCRDERRYAAFVGGVGSGKSHAGACKVVLQASGPGLGMVVAPSYPMLRDATWRTCLEVWQPWVASVHKQEMRIDLQTGAQALFRSADDPERLRGINAAWAWVDEAAQCAASTWEIVIGRLRQGGELGRAWVTTTPRGFGWVHEVFVARAGADTALYHAQTAANPFVDPAFVRTLEGQYAPDYARQELAGEFIELGAGMIRREWFAIADWAPEGLRWVRAWDLAASQMATADYTASLKVARDDSGRLWLADCVRGRWSWPEARRVILSTLAFEPEVEVGVEAQGYQLSAFQDLMAQPETTGRTIRPITVDRDKVARVQAWVAHASAGMVALVRGAWIPEFLAEAENFPAGKHDDQVDSVSAGVAMLASVGPAAAEARQPPYQPPRQRQSYAIFGRQSGGRLFNERNRPF